MVGASLFTGGSVNGLQGLRHGRNGLHCRAHTQQVANAHAALNTTCTVGIAGYAVLANGNLVVSGSARAVSGRETVANLNALNRLNTHQRCGKARVQAAVPVHVRTQSGRHTVREHLNHAAESLAVLVRLVHALNHRVGGRLVEAAQRVSVQLVNVAGRRHRGTLGSVHATHSHGVRNQLNTQSLQNLGGNHAKSHAGRSLTRGGALQHRASLREVVLLHTRKIGVTGARTGQRSITRTTLNQLRIHRVGAHHVSPLGPLGVRNLNRDRAALSQAVTHTAQDAHAVLLELHAGTAAVAEAAASQGVTHHVAGEFHTGGYALNNADERLAVGFSGSEPTQGHRLTSFHRTRTAAQEEGIIILHVYK